jgi:hypothetical protein
MNTEKAALIADMEREHGKRDVTFIMLSVIAIEYWEHGQEFNPDVKAWLASRFKHELEEMRGLLAAIAGAAR